MPLMGVELAVVTEVHVQTLQEAEEDSEGTY